MTPDTKPINVVGMWCLSFIVTLILYTKSSAIPYILVEDYNVEQNDAGKVAGKLGFYACLFVLPTEFVLGAISDTIGRKKLLVVGFILCGVCLIGMTQGSQLYPTMVILYCVYAAASIPGYASPLVNDYIDPKSFGLQSAYDAIIAFIATTVSTSGTIAM